MEKNKFTLYGALGLTAMLITYLLYVPVRSLTLPLGIAVGFLVYKAGQLWVAAFKEARKDGGIKPGVLFNIASLAFFTCVPLCIANGLLVDSAQYLVKAAGFAAVSGGCRLISTWLAQKS